jgi:hypothetical protein
MVKIIFLILLSLNIFFTNQYNVPGVISFTDNTTSTAIVTGEFNWIFENFAWKNAISSNQTFYAKDPGVIVTGYVNCSNFMMTDLQLDNSTYAPAVIANDTGDIRIIGTSKPFVKVAYNFSWAGRKTGAYNGGAGSCILTLSDFSFIKKEVKGDGVNTTNVNFSGQLNIACSLSSGDFDDYIQGLFQTALKAANYTGIGTETYKKLLASVDEYYVAQAKGKTTSVPLETMNPDSSFTLRLNAFADAKYDVSGLVNYYTGEVTKNQLGFLQGNSKQIQGNDVTFDPKNGQFQFFITNNVLTWLLSGLASTNTFNFTLNTTNKPSDFNFFLTVNDLGTIIPGIYRQLPRDEQVTVQGNLNSFVVSDDGLSQNSTVNFSVTDSKKNVLFSWTSNFTYSSSMNVNGLSVNFQFSDFSLQSTQVSVNNFGFADVAQLKSLISTNVKLYLKETTWRFLKSGLDFSQFFTTITTTLKQNNGFLIGGNLKTGVTAEDVKMMVKRALFGF